MFPKLKKMETNLIIISDNQTSIDFWSSLIRKEHLVNLFIAKTSSLENIHHLLSSYSVIILDDYFTSPKDDRKIIEKAIHLRRINQECKIFGVSPVYSCGENRKIELIVQIDRHPLSNELIMSINNEIAHRLNNFQKIAV